MNQLQWSCQSDASWMSRTERTGLGLVLLHAGTPVLFGTCGTDTVESSIHAEAEGLIWAMQEVLKKGTREVRFEMDCEQLIKIINKDEEWPSLAAELDEIKALSLEFSVIQFTYIPRSCNIRADCLAKGGRSRVLSFPFVERSAPNWLAANAIQSRAS